ncbi:MAG: threonine--tRNA ligase [Acidimicrobiales bacterium]|jgi:threonyl-tRNA synthetase|nr:threonine--tRNA ligase [Acidimicrobiaceae bacterium]MDP6076858.1 threonine--tRNA ligase [Acidimicrobiales bacterium]HCV36233.1 threonine--tRNA ligase [Acidimicrobiaceae bacterium]HJO79111.1 threonine--tRNA ligase [Acidimicrobiales bacterium]|tara:strand:+ start:4921 stop:6894 length:1974 start_codon:yes stop_codon:yes gene_type:complete
MANITLSLPDGSQRTLPDGATGADLALDIGPGLAKVALVAIVNGVERDLAVPLPDGAAVSIVTADSDEGLYIIRHSTAHVLAQAVLDLWPGATYAIGPPIDHGFYYDFLLPEKATFNPEDLEAIDSRMREIVASDQLFERYETNTAEAMELFAGHPYKCEIIEKVSNGDATTELSGEASADVSGSLSYYRTGDGFVDLCMGPHVPSTGRLGHFALQKVAGAYWRGDESQPMLQRIYGTAWASKKDLAGHLHRLLEAEKRDHRRLAVDLDLVSWPESLGPGLAVWHPRGALVRKLIEDYSRERHEVGGYDFVFSPHIAKSILWETSGHLDFYADSMYPPMEMDGATYYPKPMNCPFHVTVFDSSQRSYRDLPLRYFELGAVYRYELSGAIHGLMRSRGFTQDDAHIFCMREQVPAELASLLDFTLSVLRAFGFEDFQAKLSTRPGGKAVGDDDLWEMATDGLRSALDTAALSYVVDEGGGAFYGPKIDVDVTDSIGRPWQLSTIQLDFNLPERFGLEYVGSDGERHQPVMIHRALMGSIERFFGVLLEHFAGALPAWLAPEQVRVLPVAAEHQEYAELVLSRLNESGFRATVDPADEPLGKRVRAGKVAKIPHVVVVGDDDVANATVGENARGTDSPERDLQLGAFLERLTEEVDTRA